MLKSSISRICGAVALTMHNADTNVKVQYSALVNDMRGKHNGSVHSKNAHGSYIRVKGTTINPNTDKQRLIRTRQTTLAQGFRALTQDQISNWNEAAKEINFSNVFGKSVKPSGFNFYIMINQLLYSVGSAIRSVPPTFKELFGFKTLSATANSGAGTFTLDFTDAIPSGVKVQVWATNNLSAGKNYVKSEFRQIGYVDNTFETGDSIYDMWQSYFGSTLYVGSKIFVQLWPIDSTTGQPGQPIKTSCIVGA